MKTPYDTGKVRIGSNYFPVVNYHNPDQDWIQKVALGEKTFWTAETVIMGIIWLMVAYAIAGLLSACSTPASTTYATTPITSYNTTPVVPLTVDPRAQQMSRSEVVSATIQCEQDGLRAVPVMTKRMVGGMMSDIVIDIQCLPRRNYY